MAENTSVNEIDLNSVLHLIISRSGVQDKLHIGNVKKTEKLVDEIVSAGSEALQVISDFDATLSCYSTSGKRCETSYGIIANSRLTPEDVRSRSSLLFNHYHPIEIDNSISAKEKASHMVEWYEKKHENYLNSSAKIKESDIAEVTKEAYVYLREGSQTVLKKLYEANVPTLIFSAGSGNTVEEVLKLNNSFYPNVKVIANFMLFDENTKELVGFSQPVVHPGNKSEAALHKNNSEYFKHLKSRPNVILLGDTVGDTTMADGISNTNAVLKIGYLNFKFEEHLETFKEVFDIVLVDDQSMNFVNALLELMLTTKDEK